MAFSITVSKQIKSTGFRNTVIEAIKTANPNLNDLNFDDFTFSLDLANFSGLAVRDKIASGVSGYAEGMSVKPTLVMSVKDNDDIKRNYTEKSYENRFTVNGPDADEFIKKHIQIENLSELTWDDYDTVLSELKKFIRNNAPSSASPIIFKKETEAANSKYINLYFNNNHNYGNDLYDEPFSLLSYKYEKDNMAQNMSLKRILSFHFTRDEVGNKRDLTIENNTLNVGEDNMVENDASDTRHISPSDKL